LSSTTEFEASDTRSTGILIDLFPQGLSCTLSDFGFPHGHAAPTSTCFKTLTIRSTESIFFFLRKILRVLKRGSDPRLSFNWFKNSGAAMNRFRKGIFVTFVISTGYAMRRLYWKHSRESNGVPCYAGREIDMETTTQQLKTIIITGLRIKDRTAGDLSDDQQLLGGDLEIDSIDILQLILEIERRFGIKLVDGELDESAWRNIGTLAAAVEAKVAAKK
jgi:acyl carrier protein